MEAHAKIHIAKGRAEGGKGACVAVAVVAAPCVHQSTRSGAEGSVCLLRPSAKFGKDFGEAW